MVGALDVNIDLKNNFTTFTKKTMLKGTMWRHAQGAMLMSCAEVDNDLKEVIEKLKKLGDNPQNFTKKCN